MRTGVLPEKSAEKTGFFKCLMHLLMRDVIACFNHFGIQQWPLKSDRGSWESWESWESWVPSVGDPKVWTSCPCSMSRGSGTWWRRPGDTGPKTLIEVIFHQIGQLELSDSWESKSDPWICIEHYRASNITTNRSSDTRPEALLPQVTRDVKPATSNRYTKFQADAESRCILLGN